MAAIDLGNVNVDSSGRVSLSGAGSGIDFQATVDAIIAARRIPVDTLETRITDNDDKITAFQELRTLLTAVQSAVGSLRGAVSIDNANNVFKNKQTFASTSRTDSLAPSAAGSLLGVAVTNSAATGSHSIEVMRIAAAHKISSRSFDSLTVDLGDAAGGAAGSISGSFKLDGTTINVLSTDTLLDLRDRINNANTGATATGVTASVVTVSSIENYLVLTKDTEGSEIVLSNDTGVLSSLGLSASGGTNVIRNGLSTGSKVEPADGFLQIQSDGSQANNSFLISYASSTKVMTLTRGDGTKDTATLATAAITAGATETVDFKSFGIVVTLDSGFNKATDITAAADTPSVTGGTGAIDAASIKISDAVGTIAGITSTALTFGALATPAAITVTAAGGFSGSFDGTSTGIKTVTLSDAGGNQLVVQFNVTGVFSGTETAASITLDELDNLIVPGSANPFSNELQTARTARFKADGLLDPDRFESNLLTSDTVALSTVAKSATYPGSFTINGTAAATVNYTSTTTLQDLAGLINAQNGTTGVTATVVTDGSGKRLVMAHDSKAAFTLTDTNGLVAGLGIDNNLVIERSTNTINDLFGGTTLTLFQAEEGTAIKIDVEQDLSAVKTQITSVVDAYNALKQVLNKHGLVDPTTGQITSDTGVLFGSRTVADIESKLGSLIGTDVQGVTREFSVLAQIGVTLIDNTTVSDPLLFDTLQIDETKLDAALLNNSNDVRKLFSFDFSSSDPRVVLLGFDGNTTHSATGYTLNIGALGSAQEGSGTIASKTALLNDAVNGFGATTTGTFQINGTPIAYDVTVDTLSSLVAAINTAAITGVTASAAQDSSGKFKLIVTSTTNAITVAGDTGDLVAKLGLTTEASLITQANIGGLADGTDNGTVTINGRALTVTSASAAQGLTLFYNGNAALAGAQLDFTTGFGAETYFTATKFLDITSGSVENDITSLKDQNTLANKRIDDMLARLEIQRQSLLDRFIATETALASLNRVRDSITQITAALTSQN